MASTNFMAHSKAEQQLVSALRTSRALPRTIGPKTVQIDPATNAQNDGISVTSSQTSMSIDERPGQGGTVKGTGTAAINMVPPRPPVLSTKQEEVASVRVLDMPSYDGSRQFPGLAKQKVAKKERHIKSVEEFTVFLDKVSSGIELDVLGLSRGMQESLEKVDDMLKVSYNQLQTPEFLIPHSEDDLKDMLVEIKRTIADRKRIVDQYADDLDGLEIGRADTVSTELKAMVDRLIAIGHQLPDEIEHIVESNTFDLNSVLTSNRKAHATLLGMLQKTQVEVDVESLQRWEDGRTFWRQLRHEKGLADFDVDICSDRFERPDDRNNYMLSVQDEQSRRQQRRGDQLKSLGELTSDNIVSKSVMDFQGACTSIGEDEQDAITVTFNRLCQLRKNLENSAKERVEELRLELHLYGALHAEPPFLEVAAVMRDALADESLSELWRLGGGLKPDLLTASADMISENVAYDEFVNSIKERLELISCGLNVRACLEERGRLMQLDKTRNLVSKLRGVPKGEVPGVLESLMPELEDFLGYEQMSPEFHACVRECHDEMTADLLRVQENPMVPDTASMASTAKSKNSSRGGSKNGKTAKLLEIPNIIEPSLVKAWNRKLAILFSACDLPDPVQASCLRGVELCAQQCECNRLIDDAVSTQSDTKLAIMDKKYKKLNDDIANFLEAQATFMATCLTNIGNFFLQLAKMVEAHRKQQKALDEASADQLYDLSEDMRLQKEDAEVVFEDACQVLRASTTHDELHGNFEKVLEILETIQESYRVYHGKACFGADKYPLSLVNEFRDYLLAVAAKFNMVPREDHAILTRYEDIFDETIRFNKKFFEEDPHAGGVPPRASDLATAGGEGSDSPSKPGTAPASAAPSKPGTAAGSIASPGGSIASAFAEGEEGDGLEVYESPLITAAIQAAAAAKKAKKNKNKSKNKDEASLEKQTSLPPQPSLSGSFTLSSSVFGTIQKLREEKDEEPEEEKKDEGKEAEAEPDADAVPITMPNLAHTDCAWIRKDADLLPVSEEAESAMDEYDLLWYENCLAKRFLPLSAEAEAELSEEDASLYARTKIVVERGKARLATEEDPEYIREHVPTSMDENPWVLKFEIDFDIMSNLVCGVRDSLVVAVEIETERRLKRAEEMKKDYKDEYTDELEDRLRTHWPRRGRVETGIKQPREAELLGHEEKTWRLIQNIQEKMIMLQRNFERMIDGGKSRCANYVAEVQGLETYITTEKFRNLAKLQGVEVKARSLYIAFQAAASKQLVDISRLLDDDVHHIITQAMDFRKVCPPQEPGVEGGYSPAEILEIEALMIGQCDDARSIVEEWRAELAELDTLQNESATSQSEFTKKYDKVAQDLAMSEGLGQKYGAPRRRAQERIRTEVSRDERSAGKIDETIAKLEFECDEVDLLRLKEGDATNAANEIPDEDAVPDPLADNGFRQMEQMNNVWTLMGSLRKACQTRVDYLQVCETAIEQPDLAWVDFRIPKVSLEDTKEEDDMGDDDDLGAMEVKATTIQVVMEEVDATCRKETRELYESEGLADVLGEGGVPEALQAWLAESKEKILGDAGHREKAWKRLWGQITRLEKLVGRTVGTADDGDGDEEKKSSSAEEPATCAIPGVCIRALLDANRRYLVYRREEEEKRFMKLVKVWEMGREKHERFLRPRLGSPDAVDELNELDQQEQERSTELKQNLRKFQAELIVMLIDQSKVYCEDLTLAYKSLIQYIDTSMVLEALQLPPGTAVPKKRMTMKRMRKAQRLRDEVAAGGTDKSKERDWTPLELLPLQELASQYSDLVDGVLESAAPAAVEEAPKGKGKKGAPEPAAETSSSDELVSTEWLTTTQTDSVVRGSVSTAHRSLIKERDESFAAFLVTIRESLEAVRDKYGRLLKQEDSWSQQWANQVDMLRNGKL